jgi:hypothetical protein
MAILELGGSRAMLHEQGRMRLLVKARRSEAQIQGVGL